MQVIIMMYMQKFGHTPVVLHWRRYWYGRRSFGTDRYASDDDCSRPSRTTAKQFKKLFDRFLDFDEDWEYEGNNGVFDTGPREQGAGAGQG